MLNHLDSSLDRVARFYLRLSQALLAALVLGILLEVVLRYFLSKGFLGSAELSRLAITWIVFLMGFVLYRTKRHIVVTALVDVLPDGARRACDAIINLSVIVLSIFVLVQLYEVWEFLGLKTAVYGIPDTWYKVAPVFCFVPLALQALSNLLQGAKGGGEVGV